MSSNRYLATVLVILIIVPSFSATQIQFRSREMPAAPTDYNFKIGSLTLDLAYNLAVGYDDNTNRTDSRQDREDGTKIGNAVLVDLDWPLHPNFHVSSEFTVGYIWYASGEGTDGLIVRGGEGAVNGEVGFDVLIGEHGLLTVMEGITRDIDTIEIDQEDNAEEFSLWHNTVFLQYQHELSQYINTAIKIAREDTWAGQEQFEFRNEITYSTEFLLNWQVNSSLTAGPFFRWETTNFEKPDETGFRHNDVDQYEFGINANYLITEASTLALNLGYQVFDFNTSNTQNDFGIEADAEEDGISVSLTLTSTLTDVVDQQISISSRRSVGTSPFTNYSEDLLSSYSLNWRFAQDWALITQLTWIKSNQSDDGEIASTFSETIGLAYTISQRSNVALGYQRNDKFSNADGQEYERNEFTLQFNYDF